MFHTDLQLALDRDQRKSSMVSTFQIDDLMEKLKLLNFERLLLKEMKMKQIHKYYFIKSVNPGEQFYIFVSICAWLIRKTGRDFAQPQV
jgi:intraflagellar transport protein 57